VEKSDIEVGDDSSTEGIPKTIIVEANHQQGNNYSKDLFLRSAQPTPYNKRKFRWANWYILVIQTPGRRKPPEVVYRLAQEIIVYRRWMGSNEACTRVQDCRETDRLGIQKKG
jgi:hypothetical protein